MACDACGHLVEVVLAETPRYGLHAAVGIDEEQGGRGRRVPDVRDGPLLGLVDNDRKGHVETPGVVAGGFDEVLRNKDSYINKTVVVRGYYDSNGPAIVSSTSDVTGKSTLRVDWTDIPNATEILINDKKYDFTGVLKETGPNNILIFKATKIENV